MTARRIAFGLLGCAGFFVALGVALGLMAKVWPAYAIAAPTKHFTLAMLWARLIVGAACAVMVGAGIGRLARDRGVIAPLIIFITAGAAWLHLGPVWPDYPGWYHTLVILGLGPLHGIGAHLTTRTLNPEP